MKIEISNLVRRLNLAGTVGVITITAFALNGCSSSGNTPTSTSGSSSVSSTNSSSSSLASSSSSSATTNDVCSRTQPPGGSSSSSSAGSAYSVSVTVSGLTGNGLVLSNCGNDSISITNNGSATFALPVQSGNLYEVTVDTSPTSPAQLCTVVNGAARMGNTAVAGIQVNCANAPSIAITDFPASNLFGNLINVNDGNLWALSTSTISGSPYTNALSRVASDGTITSLPLQGTIASTPTMLSTAFAGIDGKIWMQSGTGMARAALTGISDIPFTLLAGVNFLTLDQGGLSYWCQTTSGAVCRADTTGAVSMTTTNAVPLTGYAVGRDGNLWFTSRNNNSVGYITPTGEINNFTLPNPKSEPSGIALGSDGNMWFLEQSQFLYSPPGINQKRIGRITPSGTGNVTITEYSVPADGYVMGHHLTAGPDGNMWFSIFSNQIGYITTSGVFGISNAISTNPLADAWPSALTSGPDGKMWFGEWSSSGAPGRVGVANVTHEVSVNDNFVNASTLTGAGGFVFANNYDASAEMGEPSTAGVAPARTLWWTWTAPATGQLKLSTTGSSFDTVVGVYTGSAVGSLVNVAGNHAGGNGLSVVTLTVTQGVTYRFVVDGYNSAKGNVMLDWRMN